MVAMETVTNQYLGGDTTLACSADTQKEIDRKVVELVKEQHEKARRILSENRSKLDELAAFLYEKETITGEEFMEILNGKESGQGSAAIRPANPPENTSKNRLNRGDRQDQTDASDKGNTPAKEALQGKDGAEE